MTSDISLIPTDRIESRILVLRGQRVVLDRDLAALYGVSTKRLNEQVRRNLVRFPSDFCFKLDQQEVANLTSQFATTSSSAYSRSQNATLKRGHNVKYLPYAFTEHGAIQAANVLNGNAAVEMSVHVVRAFVRLRQLMVNHKALSAQLTALESRVGAHDEQIAAIVETIRRLTTPDAPTHGRKMGFHPGNR